MAKEYVFIETNEIQGTSKETQKPYHLRKIRFADPLTFENHQLDFKEGLVVNHVGRGEKVTFETEFIPGFGNRDSRTIVTKVLPVQIK